MALETFFSLTPKESMVYTYDASNPNVPYTSAYLYCWGGYTHPRGVNSFTSQYNNNEIVLGYDPVGLSEQTITNYQNDFYRRNTIRVFFQPKNVSLKNQFLLLFALSGITGNPNAQFFVGADHVRTELLAGDEHVAILMDYPSVNPSIVVYVRLASDIHNAQMGIKGVDCYLL